MSNQSQEDGIAPDAQPDCPGACLRKEECVTNHEGGVGEALAGAVADGHQVGQGTRDQSEANDATRLHGYTYQVVSWDKNLTIIPRILAALSVCHR